MEWYNTTVKTYAKKKNPSLRFIRYESFLSLPATELEKIEQRNRLRGYFADRAETSEAIQSYDPRDFKAEATARAKRVVKEIIRNNYSDRLKMLTLTYAKKVDDYKKVLSDIKNMCSRFYTEFGAHLRYIATLEWQSSRRCLHVHMIVDCDYISASFWADRLWLQGFIKIKTISKGKSKSDTVNSINYCLKYIGKDFDSCDYYKHLYFRSKNWNTHVKKDTMVTKDKSECVSLARRYFQADDYHVTSFDYKVYKDVWIEIVDVYPIFKP